MTKKRFIESIMLLYPANLKNAPELKKDMITLWFQFFQNYDENLFIEAIYMYIADNVFFPTINDLLKLMETPDQYCSPDEIYNEYMRGTDNALIKKAVEKAGYMKHGLKLMNQDTVERCAKPNIKRVYKELIDKDRKEKNLLKIKQICNDVKLLEEK